MAPVHRAYRQSIRAFSVLLVLVGIAMVVSAVARGGGPLSVGVVLGLVLTLLGGGRLILAREGAAPRSGGA
jgi:dipeptide/tripeptide permease